MEQQDNYSGEQMNFEEFQVLARKKGMATSALVMGVASILTGMMGFFYISLPAGGLAVMLACLSRGKDDLSGKAQAGIITGILGMLLTIFVIGTVVMLYFKFPYYRETVNKVYEQNMGITLDEYIEQSVTQATGQEFDIHQYLN